MCAVSQLDFRQVLDPALYGNGDPATFGLPLDLYDQMRTEMPCVKLQFDHPLLVEEAWCITRHEDISAIDTDGRFLASINIPLVTKFAPVDPVERPGIFCQDGEVHTRRRIELGRALRPAAVKRLEEKFRAIAIELIEQALPKGTFDFIPEIAQPLPARAVGDVLGVPDEDRPQFYKWADSFLSPFDERYADDLMQAFEALIGIWDYGLRVVERKRREPGDDVLTMLADSDASDGEIQGNVATFAAGAADTTKAVLGHVLHSLMRDEEQMAWLRERVEDIPAIAVQELLRCASPVVHKARTATEDYELHGQQIKAGDMVALMMPSGNFDPVVFDSPRSMDLERDPNPHLAFGGGPHKCIGRHIGALEVKIVLEELLRRTRDIRPAGAISYVKGNLTRGVYSLPITVVPI